MLGLDNPIHIAFILVLVLLVFGAKRLPEMGKSLGAGLRGFKESVSGEDNISSITEHSPARVDDTVRPTAVTEDRPVQTTVDRTPVAPAA